MCQKNKNDINSVQGDVSAANENQWMINMMKQKNKELFHFDVVIIIIIPSACYPYFAVTVSYAVIIKNALA